MRDALIAGLAVLFFIALLWQRPSPRTDSETDANQEAILIDDNLVYHLHDPSQVALLENDLDEISGLAYVDETTLATVNDEEGIIFLWNTQEEQIIGEIDFGKDGDYEGVEIVQAPDGSTIAYVLRSDGDLYEVTSLHDDPQTRKYENALSDRNDTEGLAYDTKQQTLLVACKATGEVNDLPSDRETLVYAYQPEAPDPLQAVLRQPDEEKKRLHPSGIARHPLTQRLYVLFSANHKIAIFDSASQLYQMIDLPVAWFPQAEGICFASDGTLFIANEKKKKGKATILRFTAQLKNTQP